MSRTSFGAVVVCAVAGLAPGFPAGGAGLAAAGRAQERDELALLHREVEVPDHVGGAVELLQMPEIEECHAYRAAWVCLENRVTSWISPMQAQVMAKAITASAAGS